LYIDFRNITINEHKRRIKGFRFVVSSHNKWSETNGDKSFT
jgi:hypothetical protein